MKETDQDRFPVRKNPRLKGYDYTSYNYYFVTLCAHNKQCLFGTVGQLSAVGKLAEEFMRSIPEHFPGVVVDKYVVMPNHIHGILILSEVDLSVVVGQYKATVTKYARELFPGISVWQTSFYDHIIRNQADYERIWTYIEGNPGKWMEDCFYVREEA